MANNLELVVLIQVYYLHYTTGSNYYIPYYEQLETNSQYTDNSIEISPRDGHHHRKHHKRNQNYEYDECTVCSCDSCNEIPDCCMAECDSCQQEEQHYKATMPQMQSMLAMQMPQMQSMVAMQMPQMAPMGSMTMPHMAPMGTLPMLQVPPMLMPMQPQSTPSPIPPPPKQVPMPAPPQPEPIPIAPKQGPTSPTQMQPLARMLAPMFPPIPMQMPIPMMSALPPMPQQLTPPLPFPGQMLSPGLVVLKVTPELIKLMKNFTLSQAKVPQEYASTVNRATNADTGTTVTAISSTTLASNTVDDKTYDYRRLSKVQKDENTINEVLQKAMHEFSNILIKKAGSNRDNDMYPMTSLRKTKPTKFGILPIPNKMAQRLMSELRDVKGIGHRS